MDASKIRFCTSFNFADSIFTKMYTSGMTGITHHFSVQLLKKTAAVKEK